jgi:hypothetical protein
MSELNLRQRSNRDFVAPRRRKIITGFLPTSHDGVESSELTSDLLSDFIQRSKPWSQERVATPGGLRLALFALIPLQTFWAIWLATIVTGATSCRGPICTVATLDHHAAALLACGVFCITVLVALIPMTRGFSKCNGREVIGLASAAAAGGTALLGLAALISGVLIVMLLFATLILASTATSRREIHDARLRTPFPISPPRGARPSGARRVERPDQPKVAKPPASTPAGMDRDTPGFY